jgi:hypothetical protein
MANHSIFLTYVVIYGLIMKMGDVWLEYGLEYDVFGMAAFIGEMVIRLAHPEIVNMPGDQQDMINYFYPRMVYAGTDPLILMYVAEKIIPYVPEDMVPICICQMVNHRTHDVLM